MNLRLIAFSVGLILTIFSAAMLFPALYDWSAGNAYNAKAFFRCGIGGAFIGILLAIGNSNFERRMGVRDAFLMTTLGWILAGFLASLPFHLSDLHLGYADAFFESVSGITTTGSTVIVGLDQQSPGILLWRSITHFIGGMGVIGLAIVFLPFLKVGGMHLFQAESSDKSEKIFPRSGRIISGIFGVYCGLTLICVIAYHLLGMGWFDAVNHAMTTVATGGFSTRDSSFMLFSPALQWAGSFFMLLAGMPLIMFLKFTLRFDMRVFHDPQIYSYLGIITVVSAMISAWLWAYQDMSVHDAVRLSTFSIISTITTTGLAGADYLQWGMFPVVLILFVTYIGACSGSTSGGVKVMRLDIAARYVMQEMKQLCRPHGVFPVSYEGKPLSIAIVQSVMVFLFAYVCFNVALTLALVLTGLDFETALSGAATSIANVGPGVGHIIGPAGNFAPLPASAKILLSAGMILGRLELMTVLVLFHPLFWKNTSDFS